MSEWVEKITSKRQPPNAAFEIELGKYRLYITKGHIYYPNEWIMHLEPGHLADTKVIGLNGNADINIVKRTALDIAVYLLNRHLAITATARNAAQAALDAAKPEEA